MGRVLRICLVRLAQTKPLFSSEEGDSIILIERSPCERDLERKPADGHRPFSRKLRIIVHSTWGVSMKFTPVQVPEEKKRSHLEKTAC
jgi:hypothetical protein